MEGRRRQRGKRGRRKSKEFMDAALDGYIRYLALQKWREATDLHESAGLDAVQALRDAGSFPERGDYREIWQRWWQAQVTDVVTELAPSSFGPIEAAVRGALTEEVQARRHRGDAEIEDTVGYKRFLDGALELLLKEAAGSLEEL